MEKVHNEELYNLPSLTVALDCSVRLNRHVAQDGGNKKYMHNFSGENY